LRFWHIWRDVRSGLNSLGQTRISGLDLSERIKSMAKTNPLQFLQQVRGEVAKVVWPTRREVVLTTIMVFILAAITATFFSIVDLGIRTGLSALLSAF